MKSVNEVLMYLLGIQRVAKLSCKAASARGDKQALSKWQHEYKILSSLINHIEQ